MKDEDEGGTDSTSPPTPPATPPPPPPPLRTSLFRRNSIVFPTPPRTLRLLPIKRHNTFSFPNGSAPPSLPPTFDIELAPLKSTPSLCYTSLRDLISTTSVAAVNSPASAAAASSSCYQIPIRNRLVKQAAWAYLQPMSSCSSSSSSHSHLFFRRLWVCVSTWLPVERPAEFVKGRVFPVLRRILDRVRCTIRSLIAR